MRVKRKFVDWKKSLINFHFPAKLTIGMETKEANNVKDEEQGGTSEQQSVLIYTREWLYEHMHNDNEIDAKI